MQLALILMQMVLQFCKMVQVGVLGWVLDVATGDLVLGGLNMRWSWPWRPLIDRVPLVD